MGMLWTDNNWKSRLKRLTVKIGSSPFLPLLAWGKVAESLFTSVPFTPSFIAALLASVWFVFAEDFAEYTSKEYERLQDVFNDE